MLWAEMGKLCEILKVEDLSKFEDHLLALEDSSSVSNAENRAHTAELQGAIPRMLFTIRILGDLAMKKVELRACDCGYREFSGKPRRFGKDFCPDCGGPHVPLIWQRDVTLSDMLAALDNWMKGRGK